MNETLAQKQRRFLPLVAKLIDFAYAQGYELTAGECYRTPEQAALNAQHGSGIANSLHTLRLAVDLQLFRGGVYLTDTASYEWLGEFWKTLDPECSWGGDFQTRPDGNHFSLSWGGIR
jgi:D-alanyl-D-alanine carboxypeptidase